MNTLKTIVPPVVCPVEEAIYLHLKGLGFPNVEPVPGDLVILSEPDLHHCNVGFFEDYVDEGHRECRIASFPQGGDQVTWLREELRVVPVSALGEEVFGQCPQLIGLPRDESWRVISSFRRDL